MAWEWVAPVCSTAVGLGGLLVGWRSQAAGLAAQQVARDREASQHQTETRRAERLVAYAPVLKVSEAFDRLLRDYGVWTALMSRPATEANPLGRATEVTAEFDEVVTAARLVASGPTRLALDRIRSAMAEVQLLHGAGVDMEEFQRQHPGTSDRLLDSIGHLSDAMARDLDQSTLDDLREAFERMAVDL